MELRYIGDGVGTSEKDRFPYIASKRLKDAVNIALELERPLLVKGPPGCGKTTLARAIAHELELPEPLEWHVKSTSRARDGVYTIDAVRRLQDAQRKEPRAKSVIPYIRFGPLGEAIKAEEQFVVLIDEIDKADIDFPNDLLQELDESKFVINEVYDEDLVGKHKNFPREYANEPRPIVVITSNDEKQLPDAFLRRCIFHYIDFPDPDSLKDIVDINAEARGLDLDEDLVLLTIQRLEEARKVPELRKPPATSELIDWITILHKWGITAKNFDAANVFTDLPNWEVLFKYQQDIQQVHATYRG